jgi:hypothetical protein
MYVCTLQAFTGTLARKLVGFVAYWVVQDTAVPVRPIKAVCLFSKHQLIRSGKQTGACSWLDHFITH